jgi:catechol 2,3-dioxygenase-like lactoylglutathione lyase family enzyme
VITQLGYLGINVGDLDRWEAFARDILGLQAAREDGVLYLRMDERQYRFALHAGPQDDLAYVGWEVADEPALAAMIERIGKSGVAVERASHAQRRHARYPSRPSAAVIARPMPLAPPLTSATFIPESRRRGG